MTREVRLDWTPGYPWGAGIGLPRPPVNRGLYQITRVWSGREYLLYLGIVWSERRTFRRRIYEHRRDWLGDLRGVRFRFAGVLARRGLVCDRALIEEIEGALINQLQPGYNTSKRGSYSLRRDFNIVNTGERGQVPRRVNTEDHEWAGAPGGRARAVA